MKALKIILKSLLNIVVLLLILVCIALIYAEVTTLHPRDVMAVNVEGNNNAELNLGDSVKILSWNIGYGGLGDNEDFVMDGGKNANPKDKSRVEANLNDLITKVKANNADIVLFQEMDLNSKRSFGINEKELFSTGLENKYNNSFALNFRVGFLPYPITDPIGYLNSGISTFSKYGVSEATRHQLPIPFSWPISMLNLKRCLLVNRIPIKNSDKELVVINLHLEAYDDGEGKIKQTQQLKALMDTEMQKGNYVVAGGDFNQTFSNIDTSKYPNRGAAWQAGSIDAAQFTGWNLIMDNTNPTCRSLDKPLAGADKATFQYYVIDGFICSPNVTVSSATTLNYDFVSTDHNPVLLEIVL